MQGSQRAASINATLDFRNPVSRWFVNRGMVAWFKSMPGVPGRFGGFTWLDFVSGIKATLNGTATANGFRSTKRPGGFGSWLGDGSTGYVTLPSPSTLLSSSGTFSLWWYAPWSSGDSTNHVLFDATNVGGDFFRVQHFSDNNWYIGWRVSGTDYRATGAMSTSANTWYKLDVTWGVGGTKAYLNSASKLSNVTQPTTATLTSARIGASIDNLVHTSMNADDGRFLNRALSAAEVAALYQDDLAGSPQSLNWQKRRTVILSGAPKSGAALFFLRRGWAA